MELVCAVTFSLRSTVTWSSATAGSTIVLTLCGVCPAAGAARIGLLLGCSLVYCCAVLVRLYRLMVVARMCFQCEVIVDVSEAEVYCAYERQRELMACSEVQHHPWMSSYVLGMHPCLC